MRERERAERIKAMKAAESNRAHEMGKSAESNRANTVSKTVESNKANQGAKEERRETSKTPE